MCYVSAAIAAACDSVEGWALATVLSVIWAVGAIVATAREAKE